MTTASRSTTSARCAMTPGTTKPAIHVNPRGTSATSSAPTRATGAAQTAADHMAFRRCKTTPSKTRTRCSVKGSDEDRLALLRDRRFRAGPRMGWARRDRLASRTGRLLPRGTREAVASRKEIRTCRRRRQEKPRSGRPHLRRLPVPRRQLRRQASWPRWCSKRPLGSVRSNRFGAATRMARRRERRERREELGRCRPTRLGAARLCVATGPDCSARCRRTAPTGSGLHHRPQRCGRRSWSPIKHRAVARRRSPTRRTR